MNQEEKKDKKKYKKPSVESHMYTERNALACGKVPTVPGDPDCNDPTFIPGAGSVS